MMNEIYHGIGHFCETQFFDEVINSSLFVTLWYRTGQSECCGKTQILPHGQGTRDHIFLHGYGYIQRSEAGRRITFAQSAVVRQITAPALRSQRGT